MYVTSNNSVASDVPITGITNLLGAARHKKHKICESVPTQQRHRIHTRTWIKGVQCPSNTTEQRHEEWQ